VRGRERSDYKRKKWKIDQRWGQQEDLCRRARTEEPCERSKSNAGSLVHRLRGSRHSPFSLLREPPLPPKVLGGWHSGICLL
jgi:hypothetical protein